MALQTVGYREHCSFLIGEYDLVPLLPEIKKQYPGDFANGN